MVKTWKIDIDRNGKLTIDAVVNLAEVKES